MRRLYHVSRAAHARRCAFAALIALLAIVLGLVCAPRAFAQHEEQPAPAPAVASVAAVTPAVPSASGSSAARAALPGEIRVHEKIVITLRAARAGHSAQERAKAANNALEGLLAQSEDMGEARFEETQGTAVVYVGKTPIVTLGEEDVVAAGEASLTVVAAQVTARLGQAVSTERKRSATALTNNCLVRSVISGSKVGLKISFADRADETASLANYICPDHNYLESWNDYNPKKGHYSLSQPTITPLFAKPNHLYRLTILIMFPVPGGFLHDLVLQIKE